jgi:hypothetical protein
MLGHLGLSISLELNVRAGLEMPSLLRRAPLLLVFAVEEFIVDCLALGRKGWGAKEEWIGILRKVE